MTWRHCIIVRHAHAEWPEYAGPDFDRPLTPHGMAQARATGSAIRAAGFAPTRLLASPALRTRQTAELLAEALGLAPESIVFIAALYNAPAGALAAALQEQATDLPLLVAHNPGVSELARRLSGDALLPPFSPADWRHLPAP